MAILRSKAQPGYPQHYCTLQRPVAQPVAIADAAQNIMICAVGVSSHEIGELAHIGGTARVLAGLSRLSGGDGLYRDSASDGPRTFGLGVVSRPRLGYPAELLLDLVVQREGIKLGVTQQHAGHSIAGHLRQAGGSGYPIRSQAAGLRRCAAGNTHSAAVRCLARCSASANTARRQTAFVQYLQSTTPARCVAPWRCCPRYPCRSGQLSWSGLLAAVGISWFFCCRMGAVGA